MLIYLQCARLGSRPLKSFNFKDKSLGKLHKQTQASSVTLILDIGIGKTLECVEKSCYSQNMMVVFFKKVHTLGIAVEKALNDINYMNTSTGSLY